MTKTEKILDLLRQVDWGAAPRSAKLEDLDGATAYLRMYAKIILENTEKSSQAITPFASPLQVLGVTDVHLQDSVVEECHRLTGESPLAYDKVFAMRALEWAALCESGHPSTYGREDMFDALLGLVVKRVPALIRKGNWVVDESIFPLVDWIHRYGR